MENVERRNVTNALKAFISTYTQKQIGVVKVPSENPTLPYAILYPIFSPPGVGSWLKPEEDHELVYQITCVGRTFDQCAGMSDRVNNCIVGRNASGQYLQTMAFSGSLAGLYVQDRRCDTLGGIVPSGNELFQSPDVYRITVGR